jgi:hypothetical protein
MYILNVLTDTKLLKKRQHCYAGVLYIVLLSLMMCVIIFIIIIYYI